MSHDVDVSTPFEEVPVVEKKHDFKHNRDKKKNNFSSHWWDNHWGQKKRSFSFFKIFFFLSIVFNIYFFVYVFILWLDYQVKNLYDENQKTYTTLQSIQSVLNGWWLLKTKTK